MLGEFLKRGFRPTRTARSCRTGRIERKNLQNRKKKTTFVRNRNTDTTNKKNLTNSLPMKKLFLLLSLSVLAAGCDKGKEEQGGGSSFP